MKLFLFALCCFFTTCLAETADESAAICVGQRNIDTAPCEDPKCLLYRILERSGVVTGDCNFSVEKLKELIPGLPKEAELRMPQCLQEHREPDCCKRMLALNVCGMDTNE